MHTHSHGHPSSQNRILITLALTTLIMLVEAVGGYVSHSLGLLADAGHMLTDVLALVVAWCASALAKKPADSRRTYGYQRLEVLAALLNGIALVVLSGSIVSESIRRWAHPAAVETGVMSGVAAIGLVVNLAGLWLLKGHGHNINMRGAFLHILGDTISSVGVLISAFVIAQTGWYQLDALVSLGIACIIAFGSISLLRDVVDVLLESVPRHLSTEEIHASMCAMNGVADVHDLHIWSIGNGVAALSAHVVMLDPKQNTHALLCMLQKHLLEEHHIEHVTLQLEASDAECLGCFG